MTLGPVMLDIEGIELNEADRRRLTHPLVGGVIYFARNFISKAQITALTAEIRALRSTLLICVDHEGGRVQRFKDGFTLLPPMRKLGEIYDLDAVRGKAAAHAAGYIMAVELRACGIDFSFTPVLDLDFGESSVIGDRAFHRDPQIVAELAHALMQGLHEAGMAAVGKHFPGHGFVRADSHLEVPVDDRDYADMVLDDLIPFARMSHFGLEGIMPAHVIYPKIAPHPAGFSSKWIQDVLRGELEFDGVVFSDDLSMEGAAVAGGITDRAYAALQAGCDMVLVCNAPEAADTLLSELKWTLPPVSLVRLLRMHGRGPAPLESVTDNAVYRDAIALLRDKALIETVL